MKTIRKSILLPVLSIIMILPGNDASAQNAGQKGFLTDQKRYETVRTAYEEKESVVRAKLKEMNLDPSNLNILMIAYKADTQLEIYAKSIKDTLYKKLITYDICNLSGVLGPKRQQGDFQVPEGFYHIDRFNPTSSFYLSLGINYPNKADRIKKTAANAGGDIFIHGTCATIGCLPMTTEKIKEIYIYALEARNNGQLKIPVYIFPFRMTDANMEHYRIQNQPDQGLMNFWKNLKTGYDKFLREGTEIYYSADIMGNYIFR